MPTYEYTDWYQDPDYEVDQYPRGSVGGLYGQWVDLNYVSTPAPVGNNDDLVAVASVIMGDADHTYDMSERNGFYAHVHYRDGSGLLGGPPFGRTEYVASRGARRYGYSIRGANAWRYWEAEQPFPPGSVGMEIEGGSPYLSSAVGAVLTDPAFYEYNYERLTNSPVNGGLWWTWLRAYHDADLMTSEVLLNFDMSTEKDRDSVTLEEFFMAAGGNVDGPEFPRQYPREPIDLTDHLFGDPRTEGYVVLASNVHMENMPTLTDPEAHLGTNTPNYLGFGSFFGGVENSGNPLARYTLRPPRYRYVIEVPDVLDVVRQYPRDDGRGLSAASRRVPLPKAKRVVGGYQ